MSKEKELILRAIGESNAEYADMLFATYKGKGSSLSNKVIVSALKKDKKFCNNISTLLIDAGLVVYGSNNAKEWSCLDSEQGGFKVVSGGLQGGFKVVSGGLQGGFKVVSDKKDSCKKTTVNKISNLAEEKKEWSLKQKSQQKTSKMMLRRIQKDTRVQMMLKMFLDNSPLFSDIIFSYLEASDLVNDLENSYEDVGRVFNTYKSNCVVSMKGISSNIHFDKTVLPMLESLGFIENGVHGFRWIDAEKVNHVVSSIKKYSHSEADSGEEIIIDEVKVESVNDGTPTNEELMKQAEEIEAKLKKSVKKAASLIPVASKWVKNKIGTTDDLVEAYKNNKGNVG